MTACATTTGIAWTGQDFYIRFTLTITAAMPFTDASGYSFATVKAERNGVTVTASEITLEDDNLTFLAKFDAGSFTAGRWDAQLQVIKSGFPLTATTEIVAYQSL